MKIFNGLARDEIARQNARLMSPTGRPTHIQQHADGSFAKLITCPKCQGKGLPLHNSLDAAWTAQCLKCAAVFAFHERGTNPMDAIRAAGHRDRHPLIRERGEGRRRHIDANAFADVDLEARGVGYRRAASLGLLPTRQG